MPGLEQGRFLVTKSRLIPTPRSWGSEAPSTTQPTEHITGNHPVPGWALGVRKAKVSALLLERWYGIQCSGTSVLTR